MLSDSFTAVFLVEGSIPGPGGGAIFYGKGDSGEKVSAAFDYKWMGRLPVKDEVWRVTGTRKPSSEYPETIHVKEAAPIVPPVGELTKQFLCKAEQFRGFGFGAGKLEILEVGLAFENISLRDALNEGQVDRMAKFLPVGMVEKLVQAWRQSLRECEIYEFLDKYGFDRSLATAVQKVFKGNVVIRLKEDPYRLLAFGTSTQDMWKVADAAASLLGIGRKDPRRLAASVVQALYHQLTEGHTLVSLDVMRRLVKGFLKTKSDLLFEEAVRAAARQKAVVFCEGGLQALGPASMEARVEAKLAVLAKLDLANSQLGLFSPDADRLNGLLAEISAGFGKLHGGEGLNPEQLEAVRAICTSYLCTISGGAGTGKTTILRAVHDVAASTGGHVFQMALAGRAKERLEEATGRRAYTIHAFIERLIKGRAGSDKDGVVVEEGAHILIDEASMVDLALFHKLLTLLPDKVRLCLVGDPGQLPPIGFGLVFHLLVGIDCVRNVELKKIIRQSDVTGIPGISRSLRCGILPALSEFASADEFGGVAEGVAFVSVEDTAKMAASLFEISRKLGHDCQVLCARRRKGDDSSVQVNRYFQYRRSDAQNCVQLARWGMFVGEPVIVTRNSYELGLFNGTLGTLARLEGHSPVFRFGSREVKLNDEQMVELGIEQAYGITVHKAQGSEFNRVIVPVTESKGLDRSLLYTAMTRARQQVVFVGNRKDFERAIEAEPNVASISVGFNLTAAIAAKGI